MDYWKVKMINLIEVSELDKVQLQSLLGRLRCEVFQAYKNWYLCENPEEGKRKDEDRILQALLEMGAWILLEERVISQLEKQCPDELFHDLRMDELEPDSEKNLYYHAKLLAENIDDVSMNREMSLEDRIRKLGIFKTA